MCRPHWRNRTFQSVRGMFVGGWPSICCRRYWEANRLHLYLSELGVWELQLSVQPIQC
jgi:hypothetical protein